MKFIFGFILFLALGCTQKATHTDRNISTKHNFVEANPQNMSKPRKSFDTKIVSSSNGQNIVTLTGHFTPSQNNADGRLIWKIGSKQGQVISKNLEANVEMVAGKLQTHEIQVRNLQNGDRIVFLPYFMKDNEKHGAPAIYVHGEDGKAKKSAFPEKFSKPNRKKRIFQ